MREAAGVPKRAQGRPGAVARPRPLGRGGLLLALLFAFLAAFPALAHESGEVTIGFDEKLGSYVPLDTRFTGSDGQTLVLRDLVKAPTILVLGYYRCKNECNSLYTGLAVALREVQAAPMGGYRILSVSINPKEGPADAREKEGIALAAIEKSFPPEAWRFLVSDHDNIDRLCDSVGFLYTQKGEDFDHPLGLVILSPEGKIVRYMTGTDFLPMDLSMSLLEASAGIVRPTVAKLLRFCFNYNAEKRQFGFDFLRVSGIVVSALVAGFVLYLVLSGRRRSGKRAS
jgi:protein SCO1/2